MPYLRALAILLVLGGCATKDKSTAVNFHGCFITCSACVGLDMGCVDEADAINMDVEQEIEEPGAGMEMMKKK